MSEKTTLEAQSTQSKKDREEGKNEDEDDEEHERLAGEVEDCITYRYKYRLSHL